ncbi:hypothetical protein [Carboxylicivirga sp. M1479]|uniref:hypothetical protein n=1 Tax=Carboxylicivirga sp. M1479 TaxID=2594476 RepID=UPI001178731A|nr:hypothetical protein [Carboxylicivirga sp. M1479]TRX61906.1 hypothetical protein FNN09_20055 [Carboxylicivirga sp. M1479]
MKDYPTPLFEERRVNIEMAKEKQQSDQKNLTKSTNSVEHIKKEQTNNLDRLLNDSQFKQ